MCTHRIMHAKTSHRLRTILPIIWSALLCLALLFSAVPRSALPCSTLLCSALLRFPSTLLCSALIELPPIQPPPPIQHPLPIQHPPPIQHPLPIQGVAPKARRRGAPKALRQWPRAPKARVLGGAQGATNARPKICTARGKTVKVKLGRRHDAAAFRMKA